MQVYICNILKWFIMFVEQIDNVSHLVVISTLSSGLCRVGINNYFCLCEWALPGTLFIYLFIFFFLSKIFCHFFI